MMKFRWCLLFCLLPGYIPLIAQSSSSKVPAPSKRPKLVVGIVVDQMRWDYLYRYYDRYAADGGFKRLIGKGFSCENTFINYLPSYTACGHTCIYTGSVPAIHGITGNSWYDYRTGAEMYCTDDSSAIEVGGTGPAGKMSPENMKTTTICDELKLATNFRSKVIGIAIKDRGGILPAGHSANAAYWYESATGNWISSTYYLKSLPRWVSDFNAKKYPDQYFKKGWNTLYPINTYSQSTEDHKQYEAIPFGKEATGFPYALNEFIGSKYGVLPATPYGNTLTKDLAVAAIDGEELGKDSITDFLAVSFSSTDYVGHSFGPNSIEIEDTYLRLDRDFGDLFKTLDKKVGKGEWLVFVSADHGVAHAPGFSEEKRLPGGTVYEGEMIKSLDTVLRRKFGNYKFMLSNENNQISFDHDLIDSVKADLSEISNFAKMFLSHRPEIYRVFETDKILTASLPEPIRTKAVNAYFPGRSGDLQYLFFPGWMSGTGTGTTHGTWNPYDTHIPLVWYGWNIKSGKSNRELYMTDIAPTIAALLHIQMPSGAVGKPIEEIIIE
jgi:predicted AlkP superfamily pyrophosphatase or phosphodiesterase